MVTESQRKALKILLIPMLGANPTTIVVEPFVGSEIALRMPIFSTLMQVAEWIVSQALGQDDPGMLIKIIRSVDDGSGRMASLVMLAETLEAQPERWQGPPDAAVDWSLDGDPLQIVDGRPFVDRLAFRRLLPRLGAPDPPPSCAVIKGGDGHGKTYLTEFCKALAGHWEKKQPNLLRVGLSSCPTSTSADLTPDILATDLAAGLETNFAVMPRPHEDEHRWARNLASWIVEATPSGALPGLAILDGFDRPGVPSAVLTFIEELVHGVQQSSTSGDRLQVMLLGYDPGRLERRELELETCVLQHIGEEQIEEWFRKRFPGQPEYRYEETVDLIKQRLPAGGAMRMRRLCALMVAASNGFRGTA